MLTVVAFHYHSDLGIARAEWEIAQAGVVTAGARPNPSVGFTPEYNINAASGLSPWILGLSADITVETAGKRGYRIARAQHLSEAARLNVAWAVRSRLRASLLDLYFAQQTEAILQEQQTAQEQHLNWLKERLTAKEISPLEVGPIRVSLERATLLLRQAQSQKINARAHVAENLGVPVHSLDEIVFAFDFLTDVPTASDLSPIKSLGCRLSCHLGCQFRGGWEELRKFKAGNPATP